MSSSIHVFISRPGRHKFVGDEEVTLIKAEDLDEAVEQIKVMKRNSTIKFAGITDFIELTDLLSNRGITNPLHAASCMEFVAQEYKLTDLEKRVLRRIKKKIITEFFR